jgi:hypothetical protein
MFNLIFIKSISYIGVVVSGGCDPNKTFFGLPVWYKYINVTTNSDGSCNFEGLGLYSQTTHQFSPDNLFLILLAILDDLLIIAGIVAVVFVIYGGIRFIVSNGDPEQIKHARGTILNALIGLAISIVAATVVNFLGTALGSK